MLMPSEDLALGVPVVSVAAPGLYVVGERILDHAGLLAVIVAGIVFARRRPRHHRLIESFAARPAEIAVALLFLLRAANLGPSAFLELGALGLLVVGAIVFLVRRTSVALATWNTPLSSRVASVLGVALAAGRRDGDLRRASLSRR